jgi:hypothetical protein
MANSGGVKYLDQDIIDYKGYMLTAMGFSNVTQIKH